MDVAMYSTKVHREGYEVEVTLFVSNPELIDTAAEYKTEVNALLLDYAAQVAEEVWDF